jgi:hypothetical protein
MDQLHLFLSETVRPMTEEEMAIRAALEPDREDTLESDDEG